LAYLIKEKVVDPSLGGLQKKKKKPPPTITAGGGGK